MTQRGIAVMGSTGSIGTNTLDIVERFPDKFRVVSLACGKNIGKLREQITHFRPSFVALQDASAVHDLRSDFPGVRFAVGDEGLSGCIEAEGVELVVMGIVGFAALAPTLQAIRAKKTIALANKETLVVAGTLLRREAKEHGALVIPVDSEHNALYQLLHDQKREDVETIVLTASGGPLLRRPELPLDDVTPAIAVAHPNWKMGPKISVDSATLMNKGLELIEAHFLFDFPQSRIEVWVHPQSLVHGALWLKDNSCIAQMNKPDMRCSIGYAMAYPERLPQVIPKLSMADMAKLEFFAPDNVRFPALNLAREALEAGPSSLVTLNAANEIAVEAFLRGKLLFSGIAPAIRDALDAHRARAVDGIETIFEIDRAARVSTTEIVGKRA